MSRSLAVTIPTSSFFFFFIYHFLPSLWCCCGRLYVLLLRPSPASFYFLPSFSILHPFSSILLFPSFFLFYPSFSILHPSFSFILLLLSFFFSILLFPSFIPLYSNSILNINHSNTHICCSGTTHRKCSRRCQKEAPAPAWTKRSLPHRKYCKERSLRTNDGFFVTVLSVLSILSVLPIFFCQHCVLLLSHLLTLTLILRPFNECLITHSLRHRRPIISPYSPQHTHTHTTSWPVSPINNHTIHSFFFPHLLSALCL